MKQKIRVFEQKHGEDAVTIGYGWLVFDCRLAIIKKSIIETQKTGKGVEWKGTLGTRYDPPKITKNENEELPCSPYSRGAEVK